VGFFGEIQLEWLYAFTGCKSALYSNHSLNHLMPEDDLLPPHLMCVTCVQERAVPMCSAVRAKEDVDVYHGSLLWLFCLPRADGS